ncbi:hypothetical protein QZH41_018952 [Actinostola sp. cb2023]|nr:hypothetical protein QZH41_018952 [Actinostola sp. cb2023]
MTKRTFTWTELSQLNTKDKAYVAVRGKVYDVTKFIDRHPGGRDVLLMAAGRDVTMVFETYHALTEKAPKVLEKYYVGELISHELPTYPPPGVFFHTVRDRVKKYFKDNKKDPKDPGWLWVRLILYPLLYWILWYAQLTWLSGSLLWSCVAATVMGFCGALLCLTNVHDASHFAITRSPWVWKFVGIGVHNVMVGCSYSVWVLQHTFGHHPYTNVDGADPDIVTSEKFVIFISYLFQLSLKTRLQDLTIMFNGTNGKMQMNALPTSTHVLFYAGKLAYLTQRLLIPLLVLPFMRVVILTIIIEAVISYWLALTFQISHVVSEVDWPQPDEDNHVNEDWAELQIKTSLDYATDNWFWNTFTGALNHQSTHHLFPGVSQVHYPQISPIVRKTCEEFNVRYNYLPTFTQALGAHLGHLKRLGQGKETRESFIQAESRPKDKYNCMVFVIMQYPW